MGDSALFPKQQLPPNVRIWDSVTLNTLHVIGIGFFDRAVTCIAFSKSNGGSNLCAVDDSNDHVLSVWDWQKEERLADVKLPVSPWAVGSVPAAAPRQDPFTEKPSGHRHPSPIPKAW
ncbi:hypothetical protein J1605_020099 [Eschrichtius robustus]|uniref:EML-like first beta-propeller domain-containing protein n=1 Tax=Eschrichtius robustus TaxID=9764 RepID=A0AB34HJC0_ESCRO|nr:hypothetical protein J1605_020099 [Eschrichtius robustus]